jgi:pyridinium-3,5-biscarboxylic acid mononucleotide sulfurtransferase
MPSLTGLAAHLARLDSAVLGYSGGVDSALLAVVGRQALGQGRFLAVIGRSDSYPAAQYAIALQIAGQFDLPLLEVTTLELEDPAYRANGPDRCYFCKQDLWTRLGGVARARGAVALDGTNQDDLREHRPGLKAAREHAIQSPLAELGWTKVMVRQAARALGIPTWNAPSAPCLSSRIQYGLEVTPERLRQVEHAEAQLRALGVVGNLRMRHRGDHASLEVDPEQLPALRNRWQEIEPILLAAGFPSVELDPGGYRRGGLLRELPVVG